MQGFPRIGSRLETRFRVEPAHTIHCAEAGLPPVLATPWLIWFMERAALALIEPHLDSGEITVGTHIDIEHLAPALEGEEVACVAKIIHHDGPVCTFQVEARSGHECLAKGLHKRRVVEAKRLARRLEKKNA
jgi:predicted thioesterase